MPPVDKKEDSLTEFVPLSSSSQSFNLFKRPGQKEAKADSNKLYLLGSFHELIEPQDEEKHQGSVHAENENEHYVLTSKKRSENIQEKKRRHSKRKSSLNNKNNHNHRSSSSSSSSSRYSMASSNTKKPARADSNDALTQIKYVPSTYDDSDSDNDDDNDKS
eukprot:gb/GECH01007651.1/.p1 GENE.gb/GECH01007651.1/~~gb/GECH01007651.1/.p1  ORF type:complete len:162 (+),score=59.69 gb/GECH01007651.1/:1-486(+)